jgi:Na+-transporting NADH:ubiquinone oxidoreductase subunit B
MTAQWLAPYEGWPAGLGHWVKAADALTRATPLLEFRTSHAVAPYANLLFGNRAGSLGETSALLILLGAAYLLIKRTADWRIMLSCVVGGLLMSAVFHYSGSTRVPDPLFTVLAGGFLFGSVFMATDPISAAQTGTGRFIYGFLIGAVTVILRAFSNFIEGMMFSILLMNTFAPIMDHYVRESKKLKKAPRGTKKAAGESEAQA